MQDATRENKLRLLMILAAIYPEKFEGEEGHNIMKVFFFVSMLVFNFLTVLRSMSRAFAYLPGLILLRTFSMHITINCLNFFQVVRLPQDDMNAVNNMRLLAGASETKKSSTGAFSLKFDIHKVNTNVC